jgi:hypothetical protein
MATLVPTLVQELSRGSRRHEQHSRSDPRGESLSPLVPGGERRPEPARRVPRWTRSLSRERTEKRCFASFLVLS